MGKEKKQNREEVKRITLVAGPPSPSPDRRRALRRRRA
jgi:hypothetical protein